MSQLEPDWAGAAATAESEWKVLNKISGVVALIAVFIFRRWLAEEFLLFRGLGVIRSGPTAPPSSVLN